MAAGDLITGDCQAELRTTLMGDTTAYWFAPDMIQGLGVPVPKTADVSLDHATGAYASKDYAASRVITIPMVIIGDELSDGSRDPANAMNRLSTLNTAWAPSTTDIALYIRLAGWGKFHVNGRPRGLVENLARYKYGFIDVLATFFCPDPTITTP